MQDFLESIEGLNDQQKCGHILEFFKQKKVIDQVCFNPNDMYVRDKNAAQMASGASIDFGRANKR
jgi:hypothetical protein